MYEKYGEVSFNKDELAVIYEAVKHMWYRRDSFVTNSYIRDLYEDIMNSIERTDKEITSSSYVSDNILE